MSAESRKLAEILTQLNHWKVEYVLVGEDVQQLQDEVPGDVDIVFRRNTIGCLWSLIEKICSSCAIQCIQILQHELRAYYCVMAWREDESWQYLRLDCCDDYLRDARTLIRAEELLVGREMDPATGFYVPAPENNFLYYLLKKIEKGSVNEKQLVYLQQNLSACRKDMFLKLSRYWTEEQTRQMLQCLEQDNLNRFQVSIPEWQAALKSGTRPAFKSRYHETVRIARRIMRPTGVWIAIYGPDGNGIASIIDMLKPALLPAFRRTEEYRFRLCAGSAEKAVAISKSDLPGQKPASALKTLSDMIHYIMGYILKVLPAKTRSTFVLCDRIYEDLWDEPQHHLHGGLKLLRKMIRPFIPKPDLIFCIAADSEPLHARKNEVSSNEYASQPEAYHTQSNMNSRRHVIEASQPMGNIVNDVQSIIIHYLAERTLGRVRGV